MPISGLNAPVTIAGTVTLSIAEILAGWTMSYLVNPEIPVSAIVALGTLDMHTGSICFGSPEALLQDIATMQFFGRRYGMSVWPAVNYTDCKRPGLRQSTRRSCRWWKYASAFSETKSAMAFSLPVKTIRLSSKLKSASLLIDSGEDSRSTAKQ